MLMVLTNLARFVMLVFISKARSAGWKKRAQGLKISPITRHL
jgi:hypothetical protein